MGGIVGTDALYAVLTAIVVVAVMVLTIMSVNRLTSRRR